MLKFIALEWNEIVTQLWAHFSKCKIEKVWLLSGHIVFENQRSWKIISQNYSSSIVVVYSRTFLMA